MVNRAEKPATESRRQEGVGQEEDLLPMNTEGSMNIFG